jgi:pheromone a factor receptor
VRENASSSPNSFIAARTWTSNLSSKAKSIFWSKTGSVTGTLDDTTRNSSVALGSMPRLTNVTTEEPILQRDTIQQPSRPSFFSHLFARKADQRPGLPFFSHRSRFFTEITEVGANKRDQSPGASAHAWATGKSSSGRIREADGVHVVREVHLDHQERDEQAKERESDGAWA